ncbi:MAG: SCO family protein [Lentilitoribacter sp.]
MSAARTIKTGAWVAIAALLLLMATLLSYQYFVKGTDNQYMSGMKIGDPFRLIDHNGDVITDAAMSGKPTAVFFGFTHCPEVCPTTLYELAGWLDILGDEGKDINSYFITIDPERDTPQIMKSYVENFTDRIVGITGSPKDVLKLAKSWHVYWKKIPLDDDDYTMDHSASIFLIDAKGHFKGTISFGENPDIALQKLKNLANG